MSNLLNKIIEEGRTLQEDLKINDSTVYHLGQDMKRHPVLQAEIALLVRIAKIKLNKLVMEEEIVTAEIIRDICKKAEAEGKPIASSAKEKLKKTDVPLEEKYKTLRKKLLIAQEEVSYLTSLQYILNQRGELLMELAKMDRNRMMNEAALHTDVGMKARLSLYEKKMKDLKIDNTYREE